MMKPRGFVVPVAITTLFGAIAMASPSPHSDALAARSLTSGMAVSSVPVLVRDGGPGPDAALRGLLTRLGVSASTQAAQPGRTRAAGQGWHLDVFADGSAAEFVDEGATTRLRAQGTDPAVAMAPLDLEARARAFIAAHLADVITLGSGESLLVDATSTQQQGGMRADGTALPTTILANRIVFRREIDGIPVVGAGSKVIVTFLNDGTVQSFRYDWPRYAKTGSTQDAVPPGDILQRVRHVVGARTGSKTLAQVEVPSVATGTTTMDLGSDVMLQRLECGYYDPGVLVRDARAPIQAGCYYRALHVVAPQGAPMRAGVAGAVPAGAIPEPDPRWPEEALLRGVRSSGPVPAPTATRASAASPASRSK
ncbi:hypothetical protein LZC95_19630 [Pendulispora brunnea]|uniref:Uncharacterized protein n=1 Tax=Pendulispora brunnea TaxID=2905690 RepID=A0ABZ2KLT6_9BACT